MMRKFTFLTALTFILLVNMNVKAQDYVPFPVADAIWNELYTQMIPTSSVQQQYGITGDTTINELLYHKVYLLSDTVYPMVTSTYCGAIREDANKKVYLTGCSQVYPGSGEGEVVLYDFSKSVGDTAFVGNQSMQELGYYIISSIESVSIDGIERKEFHFQQRDEVWIEGLGSSRGLFSPVCAQPTGGQSWKLICFNQAGDTKYLNPEFTSCFPQLLGIETPDDNLVKLNIYPHPVTGTSVVDLSTLNNCFTTLEIYNLVGQLVMSQNIQDLQQVMLYKQDLHSGLYIYRLVGRNEKSVDGKIIFR